MAYINGAHTAVNINIGGGSVPENASIPRVVEAVLDENGVYNVELENYTNYKAGDIFFVKCTNAKEVNLSSTDKISLKVNDLEPISLTMGGVDFNGVYTKLLHQFYAFYYETMGIPSIAIADVLGVGGGGEGELHGEGAMVFKGVVDALPSSANEGEVYKAPYSIAEKGEKVGDYSEIFESAAITDTNIWGYAQGKYLVSAMQDKVNDSETKPVAMMIVDNDTGYEFAIHAESSQIKSDTPIGDVYYVNGNTNKSKYTNDNEYYFHGTVSLYMCTVKEGYSSYVYHNGEWVEL